MKFYKKSFSLLLLSTILATNFGAGSFASAQKYEVLPPVVEDSTSTPSISQPVYNYDILKGQVSSIPAGTAVEAVINTTVSSQANQVGEIFIATVSKPVSINGNIIIPQGSEAIGQITDVTNAGRVGKNAKMEIKFTSIKLENGQRVPISGKLITKDSTGVLKGGSLKNQIVKNVATETVITAGGALAGLSVGAIIGSAGGGTLLGTASGGIFGLGYLFAKKGKEVILPSKTTINILLEKPLSLNN